MNSGTVVRQSTVRDVARVAGVSTATVSRVLHETGTVSPEVTQRVLSAVKELDYVVNLDASALGKRAGKKPKRRLRPEMLRILPFESAISSLLYEIDDRIFASKLLARDLTRLRRLAEELLVTRPSRRA